MSRNILIGHNIGLEQPLDGPECAGHDAMDVICRRCRRCRYKAETINNVSRQVQVVHIQDYLQFDFTKTDLPYESQLLLVNPDFPKSGRFPTLLLSELKKKFTRKLVFTMVLWDYSCLQLGMRC